VDAGADSDGAGVRLIGSGGAAGSAVAVDPGVTVIVGSTVVVTAAGGSGLLARGWPMLA